MEHTANEQLPPIGSCYRGAHDHMAVVGIHLSHHWLIRVNVLDVDDLRKHYNEKEIIITRCKYCILSVDKVSIILQI